MIRKRVYLFFIKKSDKMFTSLGSYDSRPFNIGINTNIWCPPTTSHPFPPEEEAPPHPPDPHVTEILIATPLPDDQRPPQSSHPPIDPDADFHGGNETRQTMVELENVLKAREPVQTRVRAPFGEVQEEGPGS